MPTENERKYVLRLDFNTASLIGWHRLTIEQAYFSCVKQVEEKEGKYYFTSLHPEGGRDPIIRKEIGKNDYDALCEEGALEHSSRIRCDGDSYYLTYKVWSKEQDRLVEIEEEIEQGLYNQLIMHGKDKVTKDRLVLCKDEEEWVVDTLRDQSGTPYFVMAEVEMPEGRDVPQYTPDVVVPSIIYEVARDDVRFTNKNLSNPETARKLYEEISTIVPPPSRG